MKKIIATIIIMTLSSCSVPETKNTTSQAPTTVQDVPESVTQPVTAQQRPAKPVIVQPTGDWIDWPITAGNWAYRRDQRGSIALFGEAGEDAMLTLRCAINDKTLFLSRAGNSEANAQMSIRTSHILKRYNAQPTGGTPSFAAIAIDPSDDVLDALTYTRGRFAVELEGTLSIAVPAWSEIARVIEDCR